nr:transposase [Actinomyces naeslundii]
MLTDRSAAILAYFNHPDTSNGPTEAVNGRLEHLRGITLRLRDPTH